MLQLNEAGLAWISHNTCSWSVSSSWMSSSVSSRRKSAMIYIIYLAVSATPEANNSILAYTHTERQRDTYKVSASLIQTSFSSNVHTWKGVAGTCCAGSWRSTTGSCAWSRALQHTDTHGHTKCGYTWWWEEVCRT